MGYGRDQIPTEQKKKTKGAVENVIRHTEERNEGDRPTCRSF